MKYLFTLLFISFFGVANGQKNDTVFLYRQSVRDGEIVSGRQITFWPDSTVEINGDTVAAIRHLYELYKESRERYLAAKMVVDQINLKGLQELVKNKQFDWAVKYYLDTEKKYAPRLH